MKTKLFSLVVLVAFAACTFSANHPNTRSVEQRLESLEKTVAAQQAELDKLRPLGEITLVTGQGIIVFGYFQATSISATAWVTTPLLYYGDLIQWP